MPNPLVKRAKRNTIQKVYIYIGVTCPFACEQSPIGLVVFLQAYLFSTLRLSIGLLRPLFLVPLCIAMEGLQKWIDDNVDVTVDQCDVVRSKPL